MTTSIAELGAELADFGDPPPSPYLHDPILWVRDRMKRHVTDQQAKILQSVHDHRYTAVHSAHDLGKSFTAANVAAWWIDVHPANQAFVVSTAPTFSQVRGVLWKEIGRAHRQGALPGRLNQTEWWLNSELVGLGRKPADTDPAAFQGTHDRYVLVIIDEACGVPRVMFDAVDTLVTNEFCRVLAIGNPDMPQAYFAAVCKPGSGWNVIHLDGLESPNFTDEPIPAELRSLLLSPTWVEERKRMWGEHSALYISKVRGIFPEDADDGVVRASKVAQCRLEHDDDPTSLPIELGVDVGAGGDETVVFERRGMKACRQWSDRSKDPERCMGLVMQAIRETKATCVKVDANGIGWGICGWLANLGAQGEHNAEIIPVMVGERSTDPSRFPKLRDQIWWEVGRELSEGDAWDLSDVDDDTIGQLLAPTYGLDASGRIKVEPKDITRQRLSRSPDGADALLLAFFTPPPVLNEVVEPFVDEDHVSISNY